MNESPTNQNSIVSPDSSSDIPVVIEAESHPDQFQEMIGLLRANEQDITELNKRIQSMKTVTGDAAKNFSDFQAAFDECHRKLADPEATMTELTMAEESDQPEPSIPTDAAPNHTEESPIKEVASPEEKGLNVWQRGIALLSRENIRARLSRKKMIQAGVSTALEVGAEKAEAIKAEVKYQAFRIKGTAQKAADLFGKLDTAFEQSKESAITAEGLAHEVEMILLETKERLQIIFNYLSDFTEAQITDSTHLNSLSYAATQQQQAIIGIESTFGDQKSVTTNLKNQLAETRLKRHGSEIIVMGALAGANLAGVSQGLNAASHAIGQLGNDLVVACAELTQQSIRESNLARKTAGLTTEQMKRIIEAKEQTLTEGGKTAKIIARRGQDSRSVAADFFRLSKQLEERAPMPILTDLTKD